MSLRGPYRLSPVVCFLLSTDTFISLAVKEAYIFNAVCCYLSVNHYLHADPSQNLLVFFIHSETRPHGERARLQTEIHSAVCSWTPPGIFVLGLKPNMLGRFCSKDGWARGPCAPASPFSTPLCLQMPEPLPPALRVIPTQPTHIREGF